MASPRTVDQRTPKRSPRFVHVATRIVPHPAFGLITVVADGTLSIREGRKLSRREKRAAKRARRS